MQSNDDDYIAETRRWLEYAEQDLQAATASITQADFEPRHACFFAQQAAEKVLKAGLVYLKTDVLRTHDLNVLVALLPATWAATAVLPDLTNLRDWAVGSRYPGVGRDPTPDDAEDAVLQAREVSAAIHGDLIAHGFDPENGSSHAT